MGTLLTADCRRAAKGAIFMSLRVGVAARPCEGGGSNLAECPRMVGNSLQDAANSLLGLINSLFGAN
jgi:hypothetical protein